MVGDCYRLGEIEQVNEKDKLAWERACDALYGFGYSEQFSMALWQAALEYARQPAQAEPVVLSDEWTPCMKLPVVVHVRKQREGELHVSTREGITPVNPDDLIMRGVSGEEYPIGRDIFEQTYSAQVCTHPAPSVAQPPAEVVRELVVLIWNVANNLGEFALAMETQAKADQITAYADELFSAHKSAKEHGL